MKIKFVTEFQYWILGFTIVLDTIMVAVFIFIHSHVWTKNGYSGLNKILEDHEVDKFISHVLAEMSLVCLFTFCMLEPMLKYHLDFQYSELTKAMFASTFGGAIIFSIVGQQLKNSKTKFLHEHKD